MGDFESDWRKITSEVPQGSVLGPLLFVIYINDLPDGLLNTFKMYADDSKVIAEVEDTNSEFKLQKDINKIKDWCDKWSMSLNGKKCKVMHFGKKILRRIILLVMEMSGYYWEKQRRRRI